MYSDLNQARRFKRANGIKDWSPVKGNTCPPEKYSTNEKFEVFLLSCWNEAEKPTVQQGKKWLNHILTLTGRPNINNNHRLEYASVIDLLQGMRAEPRWKQYQVEGAEPLTKEMVKRILTATVFGDDGEIDAVRLRNKTIAGCMLTLGLHTSDIQAITDKDVMELPDYIDRDGVRRPKIIIGPFRKTKQHWKNVYNTIGCGCRNYHDPTDEGSVVVSIFILSA